MLFVKRIEQQGLCKACLYKERAVAVAVLFSLGPSDVQKYVYNGNRKKSHARPLVGSRMSFKLDCSRVPLYEHQDRHRNTPW